MDEVSRRNLRHHIMRRRNERIVEDQTAIGWPAWISAHPDTVRELLFDSDPDEAHTMDFEGTVFMGIALMPTVHLARGVFELRWSE